MASALASTSRTGKPLRIGKAEKGLETRYRGGTSYALDAAMHGSRNLVFVAPVPANSCSLVEAELIWRGRAILPYNNFGKKNPPRKRARLVHAGDMPDFGSFDS
jgi:hypothetical protein